jgi:hypothetical protein
MLQEIEYSPYKERYMSQEEQDLIFGRVTREHGELERQVASLASKLKASGELFADIGASLKTWPHTLSVERQRVEKAVSELWETVEKYNKAASEAAVKKLELESLKRQ